MSLGFHNGEFIALDQKIIPIDERGHQFGDGVYELIKVYKGAPFMMREHLVRLENSAKAIRLQLNYSIDQLEAIIADGLHRAGLAGQDAEVYIQSTRGIATRLHTFPNVEASTTMTFRPARVIPAELRERGVAITLAVDERWANCYIKSLNLLPNILAKQAAVDNGYYEAVFFRDGYITEGSSTNVYAVKDGTLYTPPATKRILHGITRHAVLRLARELNIPVVEEEFTPDFLSSGDEILISSTTIEVLPVTTIEGHPVGNGQPGPITRRLYDAVIAVATR